MVKFIVEGVEVQEDEHTNICMSPELEYLLEVFMNND